MQFSRQLVPLDGSRAAEAAIGYAGAIPATTSELLMVITEEDGLLGFGSVAQQAKWRQEAEEKAIAYLEQTGTSLELQGRTVLHTVMFGDPSELITESAVSADIVIMTTHGYGMGRRVVYGSVADRVARHAGIPVLMVRGGERPVDSMPIQRIVVPLDGSKLAEQALDEAAELAEVLGIPVLLVRALDTEKIAAAVKAAGSHSATQVRSIDTVRHAAAHYLNEQATVLRNRSIPTAIEVLDKDPVTELITVVKPGELLVMTTRGRGGLGRWLLGSVAEKVVQLAPSPVLLLRPEPTSSP